jgi:hypothetical protein
MFEIIKSKETSQQERDDWEDQDVGRWMILK